MTFLYLKLLTTIFNMGKTKNFQTVKGMKDILPDEQKYWKYIYGLVDNLAREYGFSRIDLPLVEDTSLYSRSVGTSSEIVEKEMYSFTDKGDSNISMRPEFTAGIVRSYIEHGMLDKPQPLKLYTTGPCFRYDRPQSGRYRQFHQINFEIIGEADPITDAQIIQIAFKINQLVGLDVVMQVNSIGCKDCRPDYEKVLKDYLKKHRSKLSEISKKRFIKNPLRVLDSKEKEDQEVIDNAPQQVDHLCDGCKNHFIQVLEYLDEIEVPYALNPRIVRGLDYYSRTTFEITPASDEEQGRQSALGGGGRYDDLVELIGGRPDTPAVGFASGIERLILQIKSKDLKVPSDPEVDVFLAQLGIEARKKALVLFEELKDAGFNIREGFSKKGLKNQLELADKLNAKLSLILGQKEILDGTIMVRDMEGGIQEVIDYKKIIPELEKRLKKVETIVVNDKIKEEK